MRGGKLKDAQHHLEKVRHQWVQATQEMEAVSTQLRDYQQVVATAPTVEQLGEQEKKLGDYRRAVAALENPSAVVAEDKWRSEANWHVLQADIRRRDPHEKPAMRDVLRAMGGSRDRSTMTNQQHVSTATSFQPPPQRPSQPEQDRGYGL